MTFTRPHFVVLILVFGLASAQLSADCYDLVESYGSDPAFIKHQQAFSKLSIRKSGLSPSEVTIAYQQRLKEIRTELYDTRTRLSEDIADLKREIEAVEEAFQELVSAGLAEPLSSNRSR